MNREGMDIKVVLGLLAAGAVIALASAAVGFVAGLLV